MIALVPDQSPAPVDLPATCEAFDLICNDPAARGLFIRNGK